VRRDVI